MSDDLTADLRLWRKEHLDPVEYLKAQDISVPWIEFDPTICKGITPRTLRIGVNGGGENAMTRNEGFRYAANVLMGSGMLWVLFEAIDLVIGHEAALVSALVLFFSSLGLLTFRLAKRRRSIRQTAR